MNQTVIPIILFTVLLLLVIQNVTVRIKWKKRLTISIDYMFLTIHFTVKRSNKTKKQQKYISPFLSFVRALLSHSCVTLHKLTIGYAPDDYAQAYITKGAIQSVLYPTISAIRVLSRGFTVEDGAVETRNPNAEEDYTVFDISFRIRLYHVILSSISFFKSYLKRKAKESK